MRVRRLRALLALVPGLVLFGVGAPATALANGDWDTNGIIDLGDYAFLPACLTGPGGGLGAACEVFDFDSDTDVDLSDFAGFQQVFGASLVVIDTVSIGNASNPGQLSGAGAGGWGPDRICGAVDYVYSIGTFEVTAGQYTAFLNAVANTDTYGLYNTGMWFSQHRCKIERIGSSGSYTYSVAPDWTDRPVNYISWGDAARFANWLHNGQPTGAQNLSTTEDGSYYLNGAMSDAELLAVVREADATWVIPSEDEWYKAAYHYNDGVTANYFVNATSSNSLLNNVVTNPDPGNNANYYDFYNTGTRGPSIGFPYYRTEVGEFENSASPYGTFDMAGNVWEWNEAVIDLDRGLRGGSFGDPYTYLHASARGSYGPANEHENNGFRVSKVD